MVFNFNFNLIVTQVDGVKVGAYLSLIGRGRGGVDAYSRLGAYSFFFPLGWALIRGGC